MGALRVPASPWPAQLGRHVLSLALLFVSLAAAAQGGHAYVPNEGSGTISVIDTATQRVLDTWRVGGKPRGLAASRDGRQLWETRLNDVSSSSPISYAAGGKQYVAIVVGEGGFHARSFAPLVPEFRSPPNRGATLWVFSLAD